MLALPQIQQGHDGSLLVLGRVALEDLIDKFEVLLGEGERKARVVGGFVAVLEWEINVSYQFFGTSSKYSIKPQLIQGALR